MYNNANIFDYLKINRIDELTIIDLWYLLCCYKYIIAESQQEDFYKELKCLLSKINNDDKIKEALECFTLTKDVAKECLIDFKYDENFINQLELKNLFDRVKDLINKNRFISNSDPQFEYIMFMNNYIDHFEDSLQVFYDYIEFQRHEYSSLLKKYISPQSLNLCDMNNAIYASYYAIDFEEYFEDIKVVMAKLKEYKNVYYSIINYKELKDAQCGCLITTKGRISFLGNYNNVLLGVICRYYKYGFFLDSNSINKVNEEYNNRVRELNLGNIPPYINIFNTKARIDRNIFKDLKYRDYMFIVLKYINKDLDIFIEALTLLEKTICDNSDDKITKYYTNVENTIRVMDKRNRLFGTFFKSYR